MQISSLRFAVKKSVMHRFASSSASPPARLIPYEMFSHIEGGLEVISAIPSLSLDNPLMPEARRVVVKATQSGDVTKTIRNVEPEKPPLLFVHGGFHNAKCWSRYFLPYLASQGYEAHAVSLKGHSNSEQPKNLGGLALRRIEHCIEDIDAAVKLMPSPPVLIGHSAGGGLVQAYLSSSPSVRIPMAVLMCSFPPSGGSSIMERWIKLDPLGWFTSALKFDPFHVLATPERLKQSMFSKEASLEHVAACLQDLDHKESVVLPAQLTGSAFCDPEKIKASGTRVKVMAGKQDVLMIPSEMHSVSQLYSNEDAILIDAGHDMMLDVEWKSAADALAHHVRQFAIESSGY